MSKYGATYDRSNVPCTGKRSYATAKGLTLGAADLAGSGCILVTLKQERPRNKWEECFVYWCQKLGIQIQCCEAGAEAVVPTREQVCDDITRTGSAAFGCFGSLEALDGLTRLPCVAEWTFMMSGAPSVRIVQQGAGPEKQKPTKPKVKPEIVWCGSPEENGMTRLPTGSERADVDDMQVQRGTTKPAGPDKCYTADK